MEQIVQMLVNATDKLGFEAMRIWPQVVAITFVKGLFWIVADIIILVGGALGMLWLIRRCQATVDNYFSSTPILLMVYVALLVIMLCSLPDQIAAVLYPEAVTVLRMIGK